PSPPPLFVPKRGFPSTPQPSALFVVVTETIGGLRGQPQTPLRFEEGAGGDGTSRHNPRRQPVLSAPKGRGAECCAGDDRRRHFGRSMLSSSPPYTMSRMVSMPRKSLG